jgi:hypothetical protein
MPAIRDRVRAKRTRSAALCVPVAWRLVGRIFEFLRDQAGNNKQQQISQKQ